MADASDYSRMLLFSATLHNWITLLYCQILQMILLNQLAKECVLPYSDTRTFSLLFKPFKDRNSLSRPLAKSAANASFGVLTSVFLT